MTLFQDSSISALGEGRPGLVPSRALWPPVTGPLSPPTKTFDPSCAGISGTTAPLAWLLAPFLCLAVFASSHWSTASQTVAPGTSAMVNTGTDTVPEMRGRLRGAGGPGLPEAAGGNF